MRPPCKASERPGKALHLGATLQEELQLKQLVHGRAPGRAAHAAPLLEAGARAVRHIHWPDLLAVQPGERELEPGPAVGGACLRTRDELHLRAQGLMFGVQGSV